MAQNQQFDMKSCPFIIQKSPVSVSYRKIRPSNWTYEEQCFYLDYIKKNAKDMIRQHTKRKRVFVFMSRILKSRTSIQIKTHHQKLEKKYKTIDKIIAYLESVLSPHPVPSQSSSQECDQTDNITPAAANTFWTADSELSLEVEGAWKRCLTFSSEWAKFEGMNQLEDLKYKGMFGNEDSLFA